MSSPAFTEPRTPPRTNERESHLSNDTPVRHIMAAMQSNTRAVASSVSRRQRANAQTISVANTVATGCANSRKNDAKSPSEKSRRSSLKKPRTRSLFSESSRSVKKCEHCLYLLQGACAAPRPPATVVYSKVKHARGRGGPPWRAAAARRMPLVL